MRYADFHTHTRYSDGRGTVYEMAEAAAARGMYAIGFSDHAPMIFEAAWEGRAERHVDFLASVSELKKQYGDSLGIFAGIELDVNTEAELSGLDYVIEANHFIKAGDEYVPTDATAGHIIAAADRHFGGDIFGFFRRYYEELSRAGDRGPAIVGHYDVVAKFNEGECMFSETDPRYLDAAFSCLEVLAAKDVVFEINTGAIYRGYRTSPYPSLPILRRMKELSCRVILGSDSHRTDALCHGFDEALEYAALAGYREIEKYPPRRDTHQY